MKPLEKFLGKTEECDMRLLSGAFDKSVFDSNNILLKLSIKNDKHRFLYIVGYMICSFLTNDNNFKNISNMGKNRIVYLHRIV